MYLVISRYDFCHSTGTHTFGGTGTSIWGWLNAN